MFRQSVQNLQKMIAAIAEAFAEELRKRPHVAIRDLPGAEAGDEGRGLSFRSSNHRIFYADAPVVGRADTWFLDLDLRDSTCSKREGTFVYFVEHALRPAHLTIGLQPTFQVS